MPLDWQVCSRARLTRDARFDGKFFIAVLTTGVYCRPICPARTCKEHNVRYYATASAAAEAGFRPCLRCRPECSPGTPAWLGTPSTVLRALRLIDEGGLEDGGVEVLAERLGVGPRHLRRLFLKHLGATPITVAQTRRLQFAKKLIDETCLPMSQVALASGFGCVRRFNASIRKAYKRTPTQIRALSKQSSLHAENHYTFHLHFRPPYHWSGMLAFLAAHAIPGVEVVASNTYRRSISLNGLHGYFEVTPDDGKDGLIVQLEFGAPRSLFLIIERVRSLFDLNADWVAIFESIRTDSALRAQVDSAPGIRVPGCWDGFEVAVRAAMQRHMRANQVNSLCRRMVREFGQPYSGHFGLTHVFPEPRALANAKLTAIGVPKPQAEAIQALARAVSDYRINFDRCVGTAVLIRQLTEIPGFANVEAQYIAMRALGEPDAFPSEYLDLHHGLQIGIAQLERRAQDWRPWRSYAAMCLWSVRHGLTSPSRAGELSPRPWPVDTAMPHSEA